MTPQEEQLLNALIDRLNQTQLQEKDPDAEALLNQRLAGNPDAIYMLAQTVLVQNIALDQAKAQISQLQQQQRPQPAHTTSFLGRLLGEKDEPTYVPPPQQQVPGPGYQQVPPQYNPPPQYGAPQYQQIPYAPAGQPSFLRGAFQTAAGVAAGALAFETIESMFHGFGHGGYGWGGPGFGGGFGERPVEVINNNYYDEPGRGAEHSEHHGLNDGGYDPRNNDPNDNLRGFDNQNANFNSDSGGNAANDVSAFADQASFEDQSGLDQGLDDQNLDDGSNFDDSGNFDDGGGSMDDDGDGF
ncbi:MAG: DUF2076 domain-containing protein [Acidobacteria bacterium]|nr:DUF2076 domain-containing protein [Acidobacteriota bacterium]